MRLDAFNYDLPESSIAQEPLDDRSASRLLVVDRRGSDEPLAHDAKFRDVADYLSPGDLVVVNRTRVVPARIAARRKSGGRVEVLFVRDLGGSEFVAMVRPMSRLSRGELLETDADGVALRFCGRVDSTSETECDSSRAAILAVEFETTEPRTIWDLMAEFGHVPLPPYIRRADTPADRERYQTVFSRDPGSVAAPTAGLHFDAAVLEALAKRGVETASLALHVGPGTFGPLENETVEANHLHSECYRVSADTIAAVSRARRRGGRIVAVGTTTARTLESLAEMGALDPDVPVDVAGETNLFIYPGYTFTVIDALITNFHLPRSSLLLLVSALLGREATLACYCRAVESGYRFYSYGDAMLIR